MPRLILIDAHSGCIYGDTAVLPRITLQGEDCSMQDMEITADEDGMILAARWVDEAVACAYGRRYEVHSTAPAGASGYHVYRADIDGSDAVRAIDNGADEELIEAVERDCQHLGFVETRDAD